MPISEWKTMQIRQGFQIEELDGSNKNIDELFNQVRNEAFVTSDLSGLYLWFRCNKEINNFPNKQL